MQSLEDPTQARLLEFLRTLISSGGSVLLADIDAELLKELHKTGAAGNFVVSVRAQR